jgi:signal transduction histidine kinase
LARRLARALNGDVEYLSDGAGGGATFRVRLPAV